MHGYLIKSISLVILMILINISSCENDAESIINMPSFLENNALESTSLPFIPSIQPMALNARGNIVSANDSITNVSVNKTIIGTSERPRLVFQITTPKVDYFDFVLALDSSGSFGLGGDPNFGKAVASAVLPFMEETKNKYPDKKFRISIVSWDEDIDFAYANIANKNPSTTNLVFLEDAIVDLRKNPLFDNESWDLFGKDKVNYLYSCQENETTDISQAVNASLEIFNRNKLNEDSYRVNRFILMVTGRSEFSNCSSDLIRKADEIDCRLYIIGMGLTEDSKLFKHLLNLSKNNKDQFINIAPVPDNLQDQLLKDLIHMVDNAVMEPVAERVTITDTLFSYFNPDETSIKVNGLSAGSISWVNESYNKDDDTRTIEFALSNGLIPESVTEVSFDVDLDLNGVPVDVAEDQRKLPFKDISSNTKNPEIVYKWFNGKERNLSLSGNKINIQSKPLAISASNNLPDTKKATEMPAIQGEEMGSHLAILALIGLAGGSLYRKQKRGE